MNMNEIIEAIEKLAYQKHYYCEDSWYSCPLATDGCADDLKPKECDCGADIKNQKLDILFKQLKDKIKQSQLFEEDLCSELIDARKIGYEYCVKIGLINEKQEKRLAEAGADYYYPISELIEMLVKKIESSK